MRVGILSNTDIRCGNAQYARDLQGELQKYYGAVLVGGTQAMVEQNCECVVINWHPAKVSVDVELVRMFHQVGRKVVLVLQNSFDWAEEAGDLLHEVDAVVAHEPMNTGARVEVIPHGIPVVEGLQFSREPSVGTAGFPFLWKRFDVVAEAAKRFGVRCRMVAPRSDMMDTDAYVQGIAGHLGPLAEIHREWLTVDEVVRILALNTANIFWFETKSPDDTLGQSGSVRLGLAARRPTIISRHRKLKTLFDYEDELYIADKEEEVYEALAEIFSVPGGAGKVPDRVLREQGWPAVGLLYKQIIDRVLE